MKYLLLGLCGFLAFLGSSASLVAADGYGVHIDTRATSNDRIKVTITVPRVDTDTATFVFPVTIPGTYESHLWWRLVSDFRAFDTTGRMMTVRRSADSQFVIEDAQALGSVSYTLDDSFDDRDDRVSIFHPAGTSFQGDSVFVLNHGGIVGYLEGLQQRPFSVSVYRRPDLFTATALPVRHVDSVTDVYRAETYDALVDGPALICVPDTATFTVGSAKVLVALCHGRDKKIAADYAKTLKRTTEAINAFLPALPVTRYAFLLYLWDNDTVNVVNGGVAQGALEHSFSSLYFWRYTSKPFGLSDVAAHEFLHILMPLNLHSEEIEQFNFRDPKMSRHLWLYEGTTEYFAHQALLRADTNYFRSFNLQLARGARVSFDALPEQFSLTEFSRNVLSEKNQQLYPLIYMYGPINALCLDILLRQESGGRQGLLELVYSLMQRFGPQRPFKDEELFDQIEFFTSKKVREYCDRYIAGTERAPLAEYLPKIGYVFKDSVPVERLSYGIDVDFRRESEEIKIKPGNANPLGIKEGDVLIKIGKDAVSPKNPEGLGKIFRVTDTELNITVRRDGEEVELSGKPVKVTEMDRYKIEVDPTASSEALDLRHLVLYGKARTN